MADFIKRNTILFLWAGCIAINIIAFLFIYYKIAPSHKTLALHYNVMVGVDWHGSGNNLYNVPAVAFCITVINFVFFRALKNQKSFLSYISAASTLAIQLILLVALLFLAKIN